ncbi:hypothetical protein D3C76_1023700 [compost metagenome]
MEVERGAVCWRARCTVAHTDPAQGHPVEPDIKLTSQLLVLVIEYVLAKKFATQPVDKCCSALRGDFFGSLAESVVAEPSLDSTLDFHFAQAILLVVVKLTIGAVCGQVACRVEVYRVGACLRQPIVARPILIRRASGDTQLAVNQRAERFSGAVTRGVINVSHPFESSRFSNQAIQRVIAVAMVVD